MKTPVKVLLMQVWLLQHLQSELCIEQHNGVCCSPRRGGPVLHRAVLQQGTGPAPEMTPAAPLVCRHPPAGGSQQGPRMKHPAPPATTAHHQHTMMSHCFTNTCGLAAWLVTTTTNASAIWGCKIQPNTTPEG